MLAGREVDRGLGAVTLRLLLTTDRWVHRRVETVRFLDDRRIRREVSVEAEPRRVLEGGRGGPQPVPVTLLAKELLVGFAVRDEAGGSLPVLTRRENALLAWSVLVVACEAALDQPLTSVLARELHTIASADSPEAVAARGRLLTDSPPQELAAEVTALQRSPHFPLVHVLLTDLASNFLLAVPLDRERRIITVSYQEELRARRPWVPVTPSNLGWAPMTYRFDTPAVAEAGSYHLEVHLPDGLQVYAPRLDVHSEPPPPQVPPFKSRVSANAAQLYVAGLQPTTSAGACATVGVAARPDGIINRALLSAAFTLVVLGLAGLLDTTGTLERAGEVAPVLLLIAASTIPTYLGRTAEHPLVSRVLYGARAMVVVSVLLLFAAAVVLAFSVSLPLWVLALGQAGVTLVLVVSSLATRRAETLSPRSGSVDLIPERARFIDRCRPGAAAGWWGETYTCASIEAWRATQPGASSWQEARERTDALLEALGRHSATGRSPGR